MYNMIANIICWLNSLITLSEGRKMLNSVILHCVSDLFSAVLHVKKTIFSKEQGGIPHLGLNILPQH